MVHICGELIVLPKYGRRKFKELYQWFRYVQVPRSQISKENPSFLPWCSMPRFDNMIRRVMWMWFQRLKPWQAGKLTTSPLWDALLTSMYMCLLCLWYLPSEIYHLTIRCKDVSCQTLPSPRRDLRYLSSERFRQLSKSHVTVVSGLCDGACP